MKENFVIEIYYRRHDNFPFNRSPRKKMETWNASIHGTPIELFLLLERDTEGPINSRFAGSSITPIKTLGAGKAGRLL